MSRADGKCPDGATVVPWSRGQLLVWDPTCPDTLATSYRCQATCAAGKVAAAAEERKVSKCANLGLAYLFTPVAIETLGVFGSKTLAFVKELGRRVRRETGEEKATSHLFQCLSVATQRGNVAATMGTCLPS